MFENNFESRRFRYQRAIVLAVAICIGGFFSNLPSHCNGQHTIVLRDLTLLDDIEIQSLDIDGVTTGNGLQYSWADILQGSVGEQQVKFDQLRQMVGEPLFRIRRRIAAGNFSELQPMADELLKRIDAAVTNRTNSDRTRYTILVAQFHDQLAKGQRERAAIPLLKILRMRTARPELAIQDPRLQLRFSETGTCLNLLPIWFDETEASEIAKQLFDLQKAWTKEGSSHSKMELVYLHSFLPFHPESQASVLSNENIDRGWQALLLAQSSLLANEPAQVVESTEIQRWNELDLSAEQQAIALYYGGLAMRTLRKTDDDSRWILQLLQIPATFQSRFPELSSAAIYQVLMDQKGSHGNRESLRDEMTGRFNDTWHGRRYRNSSIQNSNLRDSNQ